MSDEVKRELPPAPPSPAPPAPPAGSPEEPQEPAPPHEGAEKAMAILAGAMPWVISLLFHMGVFLVMMFFMFVVLQEEKPEEVIVPDAVMSENPGGQFTRSDSQTKATRTQSQRKQFVRKTNVTADAGKTSKPVDIISFRGGGGGASQMGMSTASGGGPKSSFFGSGGNAFNVVYVIDRSGSMVGLPFEEVTAEMLRSIGRLRETQMFHVIFFAEGRPIENPPKKLVPATLPNKREVAKFVKSVVPETSTNPVSALERAFSVLRSTRKQGKLIYLLTDGDFRGNEPKVLSLIEKNNAAQKKDHVYINTFLYQVKPPEGAHILQKVAEMTGGRYTFVPYEQ